MTRFTLKLEGETERTPEEALLLLRSLIKRMRGRGMMITLKKLVINPTAKKRNVRVMTPRSAPGWTAKRQDDAVKALRKFIRGGSSKVNQATGIHRSTIVHLFGGKRTGGMETIQRIVEKLEAMHNPVAPQELIDMFRIMLTAPTLAD